jgi:hypothetical protein
MVSKMSAIVVSLATTIGLLFGSIPPANAKEATAKATIGDLEPCFEGDVAEMQADGSWECRDQRPRYVFVTAGSYTGDLDSEGGGGGDGLVGADNICQAEALAAPASSVIRMRAENGSVFKAYLSTEAVDARDRIDLTTGTYMVFGNVVVAYGSHDLFDGSIQRPISFTANNDDTVGSPTLAWTGSDDDGRFGDPSFPGNVTDDSVACSGWTFGGPGGEPAQVGLFGTLFPAAIMNGWSGASISPCWSPKRLYCFETF